jgi:glyoxylase-like metal-dependent hydrolase (beta-lactamase superfamily II)/rhodanese-related sulfurtransferase
MFFRQVVDPDLGCASYVLGDAGEAIVVDPGIRVEALEAVLEEERATARWILETHTHADHVSGRALLDGPALLPAPGDAFRAGEVRVEALAAPGHRPEHVALVVTDTARSAEPLALLSGDSLLVGDLARPDLAVDARAGARALHATLTGFAELPDHVELWPGHTGGSLCGGANLSAKRSSTLGYERRANPLLAVADADAFTTLLIADLPARPPTVERVVARNRSARPAAPPPSRADLAAAVAAGAVLVDGRPMDAFDAAHLRGALNLPLTGRGIGTRAGFLLDPEAELAVTAATESEAFELARRLRAVGLDRIAAVARFEAAAFGEPPAHRGPIDVAELPARLLDGVTLVDVRDEPEWRGGHVAGSLHLPLHRLRTHAAGLPRVPLAVACAAGPRAAAAASALRWIGHDAVRVAGGGVGDLERLGVPLVRGG